MDEKRIRLKATIEANRISRLGFHVADEQLNKLKKEYGSVVNPVRKLWIEVLINTLTEKIDQQCEARDNQSIDEIQ
jgi:hypothetical protein